MSTRSQPDSHGKITYDHIEVNERSGFNGQTGKFRAPVAGTYGFSFTGMTGTEKKYARVNVYKDSSIIYRIVDGNTGGPWNNIGASWMFKLRRGQEVYLKVVAGHLLTNPAEGIRFSGHLLKSDE